MVMNKGNRAIAENSAVGSFSDPSEAHCALLYPLWLRFRRLGLEAAPLPQRLFSALAEAGFPAMRAVLQAQINKTDRNDARGMAQMMRAGLIARCM